MKPAAPRVTIGVTCHNAQGTIRRALSSAAAQEYPDFEILVVDDASEDESAQIIADFAAEDPRIRFVRHENNKGYPAALNTILRNAAGEFVAFFDDDDESAPARLRQQIERLQAFEARSLQQMVFCYTNRAVVRPGKSDPDHVTRAIGRSPPEPHGTEVADFLLWEARTPGTTWGAFGSCTLMARKADFEALKGFDEAFRRCAEWDLAIRAAFRGAYFIAVDAPLVTQYKTPTADKSGTTPLRYALLLRDKHRDYLESRGMVRAADAMARCRFYYARGDRWRSRFFKALGCVFAPRTVLAEEIKLRFSRLLDRLCDTAARVRFLSVFLGGYPQSLFYLARAKLNPQIRAVGRYKGRFFSFRRCDVLAIREVLHHQEYAFLTPLLKRVENPVILDLGAHIGLFALWALSVNPGADITSVEASPSTFRVLEDNTKRSASANWRAINRAAWRDGESVGFMDEGEGMSRRVCAQGKTSVEGISLSPLLADRAHIDLMKIDIEGAEEVFLCDDPGVRAALDKVGALVIELHGNACDINKVRALLADRFPDIKEMPGRKSSKPLLYCRT
ncbi:MAG: FkbM family methyltransferase [Rhodospirillales bacterium]|nr:FkbM family methyltransferase [Rhodospirillales bacterium]